MGDEPVWILTDTDFGCVSKPHGYGAPRFDQKGTETARAVTQIDGKWRVAGWVTSGGYGHSVKASLAQAYIPAELAVEDTQCAVEILGSRCPARIALEPLFDPAGTKMRS